MKSILLVAVLSVTGLFSFSQSSSQTGKVINDNNAQKRAVQAFHAIQISNGIDLYLSQGDNEAVAVSAAAVSDRDRIRTEVENGVLKIYIESEGLHWVIRGDRKLKAYVSCKNLDVLRASGGSDIYITDKIQADKLDLGLSGGSDLKGKVTLRELNIIQSGGADTYLSGTVSRLSVQASGGSDLHGYDLTVDECHVDASGGSDIHITANKELNVHASGGSDVYYKGTAVLGDHHSSGSSSITKKG